MAQTNDIFIVETPVVEAGKITASLTLNIQSDILKGHFPHQPVVPGACMLQLVKGVLMDALSERLVFKSAANMKFISMVTPQTEGLRLTITHKQTADNTVTVAAAITANDAACFKLQAQYSKVT
jgi:3-hydroxyacyl-[acyl-carrier-protein] dehydratase